jgi:hypothetical protein
LPRTLVRRRLARMRHLLASIVFVLTGCGATHLARIVFAPEVKVGEDFDLAVGKVVRIEGKTLHVYFAQVVDDSRCPMNARCVWEGNAKIAVQLGDLSAPTFELNTSDRFATRGGLFDHDVVLVRLEPTPMAGEKVKKYVATLRVEARP